VIKSQKKDKREIKEIKGDRYFMLDTEESSCN
jgi:hypothetical protein